MSNPNYPRIEEGIALGQGGAQGGQPFHHWLDVTSRTRDRNTLTRGKQYELDTIQPGEYDLTLDNSDGAFDPTNTSSPYYGYVTPWVGYRKRAQWPVTNNLLAPSYATAEGLTSLPSWVYQGTSVTNTIAQGIPNAWQGSNAYQTAWPASYNNVIAPIEWGEVGCIPGATYTFSVYATNVTASTSATIVAQIIAFDASNTAISRFSGSPATLTGATGNTNYTRLTVTATIPSNCAGMQLGLNYSSLPGPASAITLLCDGLQLELASGASDWATGGTWYSLFTGFVERWPQTWDMSGTRSLVTPTCVDQLAWLSQADLPSGLLAAIQSPTTNAVPPDFVYTLGDSQGSTTFIDSQGNYQNATIRTGGTWGAGVVTPGMAVTATDPTGVWAASDNQTVTNIAVGSGGTPGSNAAGPYSGLSIPANQATGKYGPAGTATTGWTRMIAYRTTSSAVNQTIWDSESPTPLSAGSPANQIVLYTWNTGGTPQTNIIISLAGTQVYNWAYNAAAVGDWNLVFFGVQAGGTTAFFSGSTTTAQGGIATQSISSVPWNNQAFGIDLIGVSGNSSRANFNVYPFVGDIAYATQWPYALTLAQMTQIWDFWAGMTQSTNQRYNSILNLVNYQGPRALDTGITQDMGAPLDIEGTDALTALQGCVLAEAGQQYVSNGGTLTFKNRQARMNQSPSILFGDNVSGGEIPFESLTVDYDDVQIINDSQVTQYSSNNVYYGENPTSKSLFGIRTNQTTINVVNPQECQDMADGQSVVFGTPEPHITAITIYPNRLTPTIANVWPTLLALELGTCVQVTKRSVGRGPFTLVGFVEQIEWDFSPGDASVTLQITSAAFSQYWQMAALHTTLSASASSGATTIHINAPAVANSLAGNVQLELEPGTANQETVTIKSVSGTTLTLVSALAHSHSSGAVVCDVLPTGTTSPTTWDAYSSLDSTAILSY